MRSGVSAIWNVPSDSHSPHGFPQVFWLQGPAVFVKGPPGQRSSDVSYDSHMARKAAMNKDDFIFQTQVCRSKS
ncbi:hypothetical protein HUJ05_004388 [Dendroctonus ponderosae]|nr:hypothetical protein HUJ05_004388 [Dendroctonus ponderosae]